MKEALTIIKTALEIGVFQFKVKQQDYYKHQPDVFNDPLTVFETLSNIVLRYYHLEFNEDKTDVRSYIRK